MNLPAAILTFAVAAACATSATSSADPVAYRVELARAGDTSPAVSIAPPATTQRGRAGRAVWERSLPLI